MSFRPPLCTYRLNWAIETFWEWWDEWNDAALQTQDCKFESWWSEAEHDTTRSRRLPTTSIRLMTPRSLGSKFHHLRVHVLQSASQSWWYLELLLICDTYGATSFHKSIWRWARRLWRSMFTSVGGGGGVKKIQCRSFFTINVVPVQFTIYSLSRLIRKMSDIYPSSHFVWHPVPPVPQLVQEYWCNFNAGTLPFPYGKETVSHCHRPGISLSAQWQHGGNIKHWSVPLLHQHMCLTFFSKFQHVAYQGYFSLMIYCT